MTTSKAGVQLSDSETSQDTVCGRTKCQIGQYGDLQLTTMAHDKVYLTALNYMACYDLV